MDAMLVARPSSSKAPELRAATLIDLAARALPVRTGMEWTGLPVVQPRYRYLSHATVPESVADCPAAYRWLLDRASPGVRGVRRRLGGHVESRLEPALSPVDGDVATLPPTLLLACGDEFPRLDSEVMAARQLAAGVPLELHIWRGQVHAFPVVFPCVAQVTLR